MCAVSSDDDFWFYNNEKKKLNKSQNDTLSSIIPITALLISFCNAYAVTTFLSNMAFCECNSLFALVIYYFGNISKNLLSTFWNYCPFWYIVFGLVFMCIFLFVYSLCKQWAVPFRIITVINSKININWNKNDKDFIFISALTMVMILCIQYLYSCDDIHEKSIEKVFILTSKIMKANTLLKLEMTTSI